MPTIGIICPSGRQISLEDCSRCDSRSCPPLKWRLAQIAKTKNYPIGEYHVNELSYLCAFRLVGTRLLSNYIEMKLLRRFGLGDAVHEHDEKPFKYREFQIEYRHSYTPPIGEFIIAGAIDIADEAIYDIKTCQTFSDKPKTIHLKQVNIYRTFYRMHTGSLLDGYVWYFDIQHLEDLIVPVEFEDMYALCVNLCVEAHNYLTKQSKRISRNPTSDCMSYCPLVRDCTAFFKTYKQ